jgi:hypothetical protein
MKPGFLLRKKRKTVAVSAAPAEGLASPFPHWRRVAASFAPIKRPLVAAAMLALASVPNMLAQTTGTSTLSMTVAAGASITISTSTTTLTAASTFAAYTGTTSFSYSIRTSQSTGAGSIQVKITSDFSPSSGPSVGTPPSSGDALTYTCTSTVGTACSTAQTASTSSNTSVVTFGADAHSAASGSTGTVVWSLTNDPTYKSGTYSATATFTISAT